MLTHVVLSFMSKFSDRDSPSPTSSRQEPPSQTRQDSFKPPVRDNAREVSPAVPSASNYNMDGASSPQTRNGRERAVSSARPMSMVQTYQPPLMDVNEDTLPELQPIFTFLNSHANKLYQEGYFLKLDDQNTRRFSMKFSCLSSSDQVQRAKQMRIELGRNVSRSLSEQFSHYGMLQN